ncbi:IS256 family transposase [Nocardia salmonicida]
MPVAAPARGLRLVAQSVTDSENAADLDARAVRTTTEPSGGDLAIAQDLVRSAHARGVAMTGPGGLLQALTKTVIETALDQEMLEHLGYDKHDATGRGSGNSRNGTRAKTLLTDNVGPIRINVPRDRDGTFDPVIVKKSQRRLGGVDTIVVSLAAKGLTTGEIVAHFEEIYGASISKDTIAKITDQSTSGLTEWADRPLDQVYAAVFIDAVYVKIREGQAAGRPIYSAVGVDLAGRRHVLGLWAGTGSGESATFWLRVLTELKNRNVEDIFFIVCDRLTGFQDAVAAVFPAATVQTCVIHLIRNTFKYASNKYWEQIAADLKAIYRAPSAEEAWAAFEEFEARWDRHYPEIGRLWRNAWKQFVPFLDYDVEIRTVLFSTNTVESVIARYRRAVAVHGGFPTESAALKFLYLATRSLDPHGTDQQRWITRWKPALEALTVTFGHRMPSPKSPRRSSLPAQ